MTNETKAAVSVEVAVATGMEWQVTGTVRHRSGRQEAIQTSWMNLTYKEAESEIDRLIGGYMRLAEVIGVEIQAYGRGDRGARSFIGTQGGMNGK